MPTAWDKFKGTLPYASEVFGVYQPLLGWRARQSKKRWSVERAYSLEASIAQMSADPRVSDAVQHKARPVRPDERFGGQPVPVGATSIAAVRTSLAQFITEKGRRPGNAEWPVIVQNANLQSVLDKLAATNVNTTAGTTAAAMARSMAYEAVTAGTLDYLSHVNQDLMNALFIESEADWQLSPAVFDPLSGFSPLLMDIVLSPVGIVQLYREYFYEFRTFLGPSVGHVWVSPGGTVEVYEIQTRRVLEERSFETTSETTTQSEVTSQLNDELATKVSDENTHDTKAGVSGSGGVNIGIFHADAQASYEVDNATKTGAETAHTLSRGQSERLSEEIRTSFKTTFRTSVETTNTSSRRYVLSNASDKLVNYELRRKMRQVGVQVQHIGTQLCWQAFVDTPGSELGIAELVHIAQPDDALEAGLRPPDAPVIPPPMVTVFRLAFKWGVDFIFHPAPPAPVYTLTLVTPATPAPERHFNILPDGKSFQLLLDGFHWETYEYDDDIFLNWDIADRAAEEAAYKEKLKTYTESAKRAQQEAYVKAVRDRLNLAGEVKKRSSDDLRDEERTVVFRALVRQLVATDPRDVHLVSELIRSIFDIDKMLYFVAPEWWRPSAPRYQQELGGETIVSDNRVGWGGVGEVNRKNYFVTEESEPAPMGASLGWLLQLDGDAHRNAFLNSPWVKAVVPIRPGMESQALDWLQQKHVEGADGLVDDAGKPTAAMTGLRNLADGIAKMNGNVDNQLAAEEVFEHGFDPLAGGFRAPGSPDPSKPFQVFDQWVEVLPTDQVVALEYNPDAAGSPA